MAKVLILDPNQYLQGVVPLTRGDRWTIDARVMEDQNGVRQPVDLTAASVTGYFPPATGSTPIAVSGTLVSAAEGHCRFTVLESVTPTVGLVQEPSSWYIQASLPQGLTTISTPDEPLVINDPSFRT